MNPGSTGTSPWPKSIFAITLFVEELPLATRFYGQVFGLPIVFEDEHSAVFQIGETLINLLHISQAPGLVEPAQVAAPESGARMIFTLHVDDVDQMCADLQARGVTLINGPLDRPWGVRTASFADPAGHIWEIAR
jgi:catechol 2,3-dioxygenase-like lactoylglutathione lyase family enzyme